MVFFDDAFCEGEAEAPAAAFGGVAGVEDGLEVFAGYAFAGVGDFDYASAGVGVGVFSSGVVGCALGLLT